MKKSSFVEGTLIATVAIIITKILGMLYVIPFVETVGPQGSALYAYAYNIYVVFLDISAAGLPIAISKLVNEYNTLGMMDAKVRTYKIGKRLLNTISIFAFIVLMLFARDIATLILGDLQGGNTIEDVTFVIRCISTALLVVPFLSVSKGYLQGHNIINISSISQILEQVIRIVVILAGSYIAIKVLNLDLKIAVGISLLGATIGGIISYIYVFIKLKAGRKEIGLGEVHPRDKVSNKEIVKKLIKYAIPFIIIDTVASIYSFINMVFISRTLNYLNYSAANVEFITSAMTTWSGKINMVVTSIAMGMTMSLIPSIVSSFTLKNMEDVNDKVNSALQMVMVISIPLTVGISLLAGAVWSIFYPASSIGTIVLQTGIFVALFANMFMITNSTLQSLNRFKTVYVCTIIGFVLNAVLDVPLMLLFNHIGLPAYLGATLATIIGYSLSVIIALRSLRHDYGFRYKKTFKLLLNTLVPTVAMILVVLFVKYFIPLNVTSKLSAVVYVGVIAIFGGLTYIFVGYKMGIFHQAFGEKYLNKLAKKLTLGK